jgi:uncharacterized integral membrane protein
MLLVGRVMNALYLGVMADPHHVPTLDGFDVFTVRLYRMGLCISAVGLALLAASLLVGESSQDGLCWVLVFVGAALSAANMHLYDKRIRWVIGASGWVGGALLLLAPHVPAAWSPWVFYAGAGFVFVVLSGFALKEQFCFKIAFLRLVPLVLATSLIPLLAEERTVAGMMLVMASVMYGLLAVAKLRMPLHFDIGNKGAYQI